MNFLDPDFSNLHDIQDLFGFANAGDQLDWTVIPNFAGVNLAVQPYMVRQIVLTLNDDPKRLLVGLNDGANTRYFFDVPGEIREQVILTPDDFPLLAMVPVGHSIRVETEGAILDMVGNAIVSFPRNAS